MDIPVNWLNALVVYGPLGIFAAIVGFLYVMRQVKGDPVMTLAQSCVAHIAVGNELTKQNTDVLNRVTKVLEIANEGRDHVVAVLENQNEAIKELKTKFDDFTASARRRTN